MHSLHWELEYLLILNSQEAKLYFSLSQCLLHWIAKCRQEIYNLLISRHSPKFSASNFCPFSYLPQWFNRTIYGTDQLALFVLRFCPAFNNTYHTGIVTFFCVHLYRTYIVLTPKISFAFQAILTKKDIDHLYGECNIGI